MDFQEKIWHYYKKHGRSLPWRLTRNPYHILVSEIMLQQTQVSRVLVKYPEFLKKFPTLKHLARAKQADVVKAWQGVGYNRRAVALHKIANIGRIPQDPAELEKLPGIGPYTAAAIAVFAFDKKLPMIETNIRRVFEHELLSPFDSPLSIRGSAEGVGDKEILALLAKTPMTREWYYALMDYGSSLPKIFPRPKQPKFEGSNRQIRGAILRALSQKPRINEKDLKKILDFPYGRVRILIAQLIKEGLVARRNHVCRLA